jgi:hypothetical protein
MWIDCYSIVIITGDRLDPGNVHRCAALISNASPKASFGPKLQDL